MSQNTVLRPTEEYEVKFWIRNSNGFMEQRTETIMLHSKGKHLQAEQAVKRKYRKAPYNQNITIVTVIYQ